MNKKLLILCLCLFSFGSTQAQNASPEMLQEAINLIRVNDLIQAEKILKKLKVTYPNDVRIYNNLAVIYADKNDLIAARDVLEEALEREPDYQSALINLGAIYSEMAQSIYNRLGINDVGSSVPKEPELVRREREPAPLPKSILTSAVPAEESVPMPVDAADRVQEQVYLWKEAWEAQDLGAYLSLYANSFKPSKGLSVNAWKAKRKKALNKPAGIHVEIVNMDIQVAADSVSVIFEQGYASGNYHDRVIKKLVFMMADGWKITGESVVKKL